MLAYHANPKIKTDIIAQLEAHRAADEIQQGYFWKNGKGCAVGCTLHDPSGGHAQYETQFGIPQILARVEDRIFEGLPNAIAKEWPLRFMGAIAPGADLSWVWPLFAEWLLVDAAHGVVQYAETDEQREIIREVAAALARGETDQQKLRDMRERAWRVRTSAFSAAAAAADAAAAAADAAADAAAAAAAAAGGSGGGVGASSSSATAASAAATRRSPYEFQADKLIELLAAAPIGDASKAAA